MQKKPHRRCSTELKIGFWLRVWNIELTLVPSLRIKPKKYSARKYVWRLFEKAKSRGATLSKRSVYIESSRRKRTFKRMLWKISQNSQGNICAGRSFLVFSCEFCEICKSTFFAEQHRMTASDYSSINSSERSIGKWNCKLWYKN